MNHKVTSCFSVNVSIKVTILALLAIACTVYRSAGAQVPVERIVGEVVSLEGSELRLKSSDGRALNVQLASNVRFSGRSAGNAQMLVAGAYLGTTATPQADGTLRALEVHVFPESMRGTGEGHRPMDGVTPGSTMTNATVTGVAAGAGDRSKGTTNTMTNAAVTGVASEATGLRMTLAYKGGEKIVVVPERTPITMVEEADRTLLTPGTHVIASVARQSDGTLVAERVTVGKNGFVPPL